MANFFYKPSQSWCGDFIPFHHEGWYYLFYLRDYRNSEDMGEGTPWFLLRTQDFVQFEELGEALPRGSEDEQDLFVFTGSALYAEGRYHLFYTGHNPHLRAKGLPEQAVMHAVSDDLVRFQKLPEHTFFAPDSGYEPHDWRDPFVFSDPEAGCYRMLLAARSTVGPSRRRGLTAMLRSDDLVNWTLCEPLYSPALYFTHECPDFFEMNGFEYLWFSEFSSDNCTRYVMRRKGDVRWLRPADDRLDTRAWYAAKTAQDAGGRYAFGWIATRERQSDEGGWQWGGCLNVHEIRARADGTLYACEPASMRDAFSRVVLERGALELDATDAYAALDLGVLPDTCRVEIRFTSGAEARELALCFHADEQLEKGHELRVELDGARMVSDLWPRPGDAPHQMAMERPVPLPVGEHMLTLIIDGSACCAYFDDQVALSFRSYETNSRRAGLILRCGIVQVTGIQITTQ